MQGGREPESQTHQREHAEAGPGLGQGREKRKEDERAIGKQPASRKKSSTQGELEIAGWMEKTVLEALQSFHWRQNWPKVGRSEQIPTGGISSKATYFICCQCGLCALHSQNAVGGQQRRQPRRRGGSDINDEATGTLYQYRNTNTVRPAFQKRPREYATASCWCSLLKWTTCLVVDEKGEGDGEAVRGRDKFVWIGLPPLCLFVCLAWVGGSACLSVCPAPPVC